MKSIMKFSASKDALLEGLASVPNVVATQTTLPILSNVFNDTADHSNCANSKGSIERIPRRLIGAHDPVRSQYFRVLRLAEIRKEVSG
jgi:hypothetical protein